MKKIKSDKYNRHQVALELAEAIGDTCACNINCNDEWLPFVCDLREMCHNAVGVACWEQYLKHKSKRNCILKENERCKEAD